MQLQIFNFKFPYMCHNFLIKLYYYFSYRKFFSPKSFDSLHNERNIKIVQEFSYHATLNTVLVHIKDYPMLDVCYEKKENI
jgi:hypothetical protein